MQTQSNCEVTSNTQLKTALFSDVILDSFFRNPVNLVCTMITDLDLLFVAK